MATVNLGAIKFNWKGAYNNSTAYVVDDVVSSSGSSYVCILASQGNAVSNGTYWNIMSSAGTNGTNGTNGTDVGTVITTQGDILYRDGSGLQRLAKGTAGQVLKMNSGATAPEYGSGGGISQVIHSHTNTQTSTSSHTAWVDTGLSIQITPTSTSNKILLLFSGIVGSKPGAYSMGLRLDRNGTAVLNGGAGRYLADSWYDNWSSNNGYNKHTASLNILDAPSSTSQLTYKIQMASGYANETVYFNNNQANDDHFRNVSFITAMEVTV